MSGVNQYVDDLQTLRRDTKQLLCKIGTSYTKVQPTFALTECACDIPKFIGLPVELMHYGTQVYIKSYDTSIEYMFKRANILNGKLFDSLLEVLFLANAIGRFVHGLIVYRYFGSTRRQMLPIHNQKIVFKASTDQSQYKLLTLYFKMNCMRDKPFWTFANIFKYRISDIHFEEQIPQFASYVDYLGYTYYNFYRDSVESRIRKRNVRKTRICIYLSNLLQIPPNKLLLDGAKYNDLEIVTYAVSKGATHFEDAIINMKYFIRSETLEIIKLLMAAFNIDGVSLIKTLFNPKSYGRSNYRQRNLYICKPLVSTIVKMTGLTTCDLYKIAKEYNLPGLMDYVMLPNIGMTPNELLIEAVHTENLRLVTVALRRNPTNIDTALINACRTNNIKIFNKVWARSSKSADLMISMLGAASAGNHAEMLDAVIEKGYSIATY
jgi:hypothetical protein